MRPGLLFASRSRLWRLGLIADPLSAVTPLGNRPAGVLGSLIHFAEFWLELLQSRNLPVEIVRVRLLSAMCGSTLDAFHEPRRLKIRDVTLHLTRTETQSLCQHCLAGTRPPVTCPLEVAEFHKHGELRRVEPQPVLRPQQQRWNDAEAKRDNLLAHFFSDARPVSLGECNRTKFSAEAVPFPVMIVALLPPVHVRCIATFIASIKVTPPDVSDRNQQS